MSTEIENEIDLVVQHFLLDEGKALADVTNALANIGGSKPFENLGRAMYAAMLKTHMARLQGTKAMLAAKGPRGSIH